MLINSLVFLGVLTIVILLIRFAKRLDNPEPAYKKENCNFKITSPKFSVNGNKKIATYSVMFAKNKHMFFVDFPVLFKFYSEHKFKTRVSIQYRVPKEPLAEKVLNKDITFDGIVKEHKYFITDIIIGKITFEIELNVNYGNPVMSFELLPSGMCVMDKEYKIEIKFPE